MVFCLLLAWPRFSESRVHYTFLHFLFKRKFCKNFTLTCPIKMHLNFQRPCPYLPPKSPVIWRQSLTYISWHGPSSFVSPAHFCKWLLNLASVAPVCSNSFCSFKGKWERDIQRGRVGGNRNLKRQNEWVLSPQPPRMTSVGVSRLQNSGGSWLTGRVNRMLAGLAEKIVFSSKQIIDYKLLWFLRSHCGQLYYSICLKCLLCSHAKTLMKFPL